MQDENRPIFALEQAIAANIPDKVDDKKRHDEFKPPSVIDPDFGCVGIIPSFHKSTHSKGSPIGQEKHCH